MKERVSEKEKEIFLFFDYVLKKENFSQNLKNICKKKFFKQIFCFTSEDDRSGHKRQFV